MDDGIMPAELTSESVDALIVALAGSPPAGQDHLLRKLDHVVHALRMSGQLAALTPDQVKSIVYSLYAAGHLKTPTPIAPDGMLATYAEDGLVTIHNADLMGEPRFRKAYQRGVSAEAVDYYIHWRVHIILWAASYALHLPGDFIECGVYRGFRSSAIMDYLDWNNLDRRFFLLDTFRGLDERLVPMRRKRPASPVRIVATRSVLSRPGRTSRSFGMSY